MRKKIVVIGIVLAVVLLTAYAVSGKPPSQDNLFFTSGAQYEYLFATLAEQGGIVSSASFNGEQNDFPEPLPMYQVFNLLGIGGWEYMGMVNDEHLFKRIKPA